LSFQEYFCACYLAERVVSPAFSRKGESSDGTVSRTKLRDWAANAFWRETFVFLFEKLSSERDSGWLDDLAEAAFRDESGDWLAAEYGDDARFAVAARIVGDRHVRLSEPSKEALLDACARRAWSESREPWREPVVLQLLIDAGIACVVRAAGEALDDEGQTFPASASGELATISTSAATRLLIIRDPAFSNLSALAGWSGVRILDVDGVPLSDLSPLAAMTGLKQLSLNNTQVSDLSPLAAITGLTELFLDNSQVSDLSPLAAITGLKQLSLDNTQVSDLSPLAAITGLKQLSLNNTQVSDPSPLAAISGLTWLSLDNTQVNDLSPLAAMIELQIRGTRHIQPRDDSDASSLRG